MQKLVSMYYLLLFLNVSQEGSYKQQNRYSLNSEDKLISLLPKNRECHCFIN